MKIIINGEAHEISCQNVSELLVTLKAPPRGIAVERNGAIVPKSAHAETALKEGDQIEIVGFIGGG